ncbi:MAG: 5-methyltetrahydropteroyltriglutamate--homocysteine methyltransferase [Candidatus Rokuibacteriota bacterium]|nr:MAG: 5-methyltetrahydropteroyltriglutamate--homocysteine methyltransferase [Candidatus Rokubacteria bacterium]
MLTTTVVGSYPQPRWLVDHEKFRSNAVPRVRMREVWRVPEPLLEEAQDDAVRLAVRDMERAGIDVLTDGEQRRESYFNQFATALGGLDLDRPGTAIARTGRPTRVPRVVGPIVRERSVLARDARVLRSATDRSIKITVPGPFTMTQLAQDDYYKDEERLAMAYADAVNAELRELEPLVDVLQIDEPYMQARPDRARAYAIPAIDRALAGITRPTAVHLCFGYAFTVKEKPSGYSFLGELDRCRATQISIEAAQPRLDLSVLSSLPSKTIVLGVLDLGDATAETPAVVADRVRAALRHVPEQRLVIAPDCGMKHLPRDLAFAKLRAMVDGARGG